MKSSIEGLLTNVVMCNLRMQEEFDREVLIGVIMCNIFIS